MQGMQGFLVRKTLWNIRLRRVGDVGDDDSGGEDDVDDDDGGGDNDSRDSTIKLLSTPYFCSCAGFFKVSANFFLDYFVFASRLNTGLNELRGVSNL